MLALNIRGGQHLGQFGFGSEDLTLHDGWIHLNNLKDGPELDTTGYWLLPGIIDLHGDGFEHSLAPRRGMMTDLARGLDAVESELALAGITTAWLAQFWSWEGGMRGPDFAKRLALAMTQTQQARRIDMRMQLRLEAHMIEDDAEIRALISDHAIDYVVINDHLPHAHLTEGRQPPRLTGAALKAGRAPEAHLALMHHYAANGPKVPDFVAGLIETFAPETRFGAHDEETAEIRAKSADLGLGISEFPTTQEAAQTAQKMGARVIMGAPNVVRGGSHDRRVSAELLIREGLVDALASDYHYPALAEAAFALSDRGVLPFEAAWALISSGPAQMMGLKDRGQIADGLRGDLVVMDPKTRQILGCFAAGRLVLARGSFADRLLSG
ncbi:MAG: alpha-D-ribose 1-methylphosphonate 5-triphosphate diphosphatase [Pseudomonadota bacterium]